MLHSSHHCPVLALAFVVACGDDQPQAPPDAGTDQVPPDAGTDQVPPIGVAMELIADGLVHPVALAEAPDGTGRLFVADQIGLLRVIERDGLVETPALDVQDLIVELDRSRLSPRT